jgi:hypothetical protein
VLRHRGDLSVAVPGTADGVVGWRRQLLNLITDAIGVNAMSMHVRRRGLAPPVAA